MATSGGKHLRQHWRLDYLVHCSNHARDEKWVQEDYWYLMASLFEEIFLITEIQALRQPSSPLVSTSLCSICEIVSHMADDQRRPAPSQDDVGGIPSPGASMPSLPNNPSKRPGKKLLLRGRSAGIPTRTSRTTLGCLIGSLHSNQHTLL